MTDMTREQLIANLKDKLGVTEDQGGVDLSSADWAVVIVMEQDEYDESIVQRLQAVKGKKTLKRMVAIPPKATVMNTVREKLQGTGIGVIDGRGFVIKPYSWTEYRSVPLGTFKG